MPFLLLVRRQKQHHTIPQLHFSEVQQQISIGTAKEIEAEKICLKRLILSQDATDVLAFARVDVEVYAALRFIERNAYSLSGLITAFISLVFLPSANIHHFYQNGIYSRF